MPFYSKCPSISVFGEGQSILAEAKKIVREGKMLRDVQPHGAFLWIYIKEIVTLFSSKLEIKAVWCISKVHRILWKQCPYQPLSLKSAALPQEWCRLFLTAMTNFWWAVYKKLLVQLHLFSASFAAGLQSEPAETILRAFHNHVSACANWSFRANSGGQTFKVALFCLKRAL